MSQERTARWFAGIDEAGLGPMLGPLTLGYSVFRAPAGSTDLWRTLSGVVSQKPTRDGDTFVVADSKVVYSRTARSAARLELTALGFLALLDEARKPPASASRFAWGSPEELAPAPEVLAGHPWYGKLDVPLPRFQDAGRLELRVERLARAMRGARVSLEDAGVRVVPEGDLNRSFDATRNKSLTHWDCTAPILRRLWERHAPEGLHLTVDRHGGRFHYGGLLARTLPQANVEVVQESPSLAEYRLVEREPSPGAGARRMRVLFAERAEERSFAVALGSCLAKYAREVCMQAFNAYFEDLNAELKPTAGYTQDARRWLIDAESTLDHAGLEPVRLVRQR